MPLVKVGRWHASTGVETITVADLAAAVDAARDPDLPEPVIKLGHRDPRFDGEPALGRVTRLRLADAGRTLVGDFEGVPGWLDRVLVDAFPNRSVEAERGMRSPGGTVHRFALTAVALLGVTAPAVTSLETLRQLYEN